MKGGWNGTACGAWLAGGGAPGPGLPTLHTALMLKIPLARPGLPSLAAAAGSGAPSLPPARGAAVGSACPAPAARLSVADQVRRVPWVQEPVGSSCCTTGAASRTLPAAPASAALTMHRNAGQNECNSASCSICIPRCKALHIFSGTPFFLGKRARAGPHCRTMRKQARGRQHFCCISRAQCALHKRAC